MSKIFVFSGASGVGKSSALKRVMADRDDLRFSVSATTRAPRPGEEDGVHYFFVTRERFEQMIEARELLVPVMRGGVRCYDSPPLPVIRAYAAAEIERLWDEVKRFENPHNYYVDLSQKLYDCKTNLLKKR